MQGTRSGQLALAAAALVVGSSAAAADGLYDRKLERAVMAIVAKKVGTLRGSLEREWRPRGWETDILTVVPGAPALLKSERQHVPRKGRKPAGRLTESERLLRTTDISGEQPSVDGTTVASVPPS
ncbi:MAG: hypothetical protein AB7I34_22075 [Rhizobiaceae bacterium]